MYVILIVKISIKYPINLTIEISLLHSWLSDICGMKVFISTDFVGELHEGFEPEPSKSLTIDNRSSKIILYNI